MILVIEDNETWQEIYARILSSYDLTFCRDDLEAIKIIDKNSPQLIVLDILLNGPTAFGLLNELQSYPHLAKIPIIIISNIKLAQDKLKEYNIVKVFEKATLDPIELRAEVQNYV